MKSVSFSITRVNRLRRAAVRARTHLAERPDPWPVRSPSNGCFAYAYDANDLIRVFDTLRLKAGLAPRAYESGGGSGSRGIIWAVPTDAPLVAPGEWSRLEDTWLPRPPEAVLLMQAIDGDGSPWSYLSASILSREAAEFEARWPGLVWTGPGDSLQAPPADRRPRCVGRRAEANRRRTAPRTWEPTYAERGTTKKVVLHIRDPVGGDRIYQATDTYQAGRLRL